MVAQASRSSRSEQFVGNDKVLFGIIFGVLGFWLFAQTTLNISPVMAEDLGVETSVMNIAVSITALFSGIFIVVVGGLADRLGRVRMTMIGFILSIVGSLLVGLAPAGALAETILMLGRILQGLSAAFIMPATLALIKAYWDGPARQRAVSLWSMGSWGGSGFAALFGGLMADNVGWRWIFFAGAALSLLGMFMVAGTPESKAPPKAGYKFDLAGVLSFMVFMVALQVFVTQGGNMGWASLPSLALLVISIVFAVLFFRIESGNDNAFVDFGLFRNMTYTGATISNFLLNATAGILIVAMTLVQVGGDMTAQEAGFLTIGYAITIVAFIRVGEKLLQRFGPRRPMLWGSLIVGAAVICLMFTNLTVESYKILSAVGFSLFGLGLAFYATPSTDAALSALPDDQAGSGSGIYKMASSLGASFGVAISATVYTALSEGSPAIEWIEGVITYVGRQDNVNVREAAFAAFGVNLLFVVLAIISIMVTIPERKTDGETVTQPEVATNNPAAGTSEANA
ncbi:MAG TPA: MFS transporter [Thermomicrobiales bacterium]|nr:MFS transporter [Thermomicrobiales bacterium]